MWPESAGSAGWMLAQDAQVVRRSLISSCGDGQDTPRSIVQPTVAGRCVHVPQGDALTPRTLGLWPLPRPTYDTVNLTRCRTAELLAYDGLERRLESGDALQYPKLVFSASSQEQGARDFLLTVNSKPRTLHRPDPASSSSTSRKIPLTAMVSETQHGRDTTWIAQGQTGLLTSSTRPGPAVSWIC